MLFIQIQSSSPLFLFSCQRRLFHTYSLCSLPPVSGLEEDWKLTRFNQTFATKSWFFSSWECTLKSSSSGDEKSYNRVHHHDYDIIIISHEQPEVKKGRTDQRGKNGGLEWEEVKDITRERQKMSWKELTEKWCWLGVIEGTGRKCPCSWLTMSMICWSVRPKLTMSGSVSLATGRSKTLYEAISSLSNRRSEGPAEAPGIYCVKSWETISKSIKGAMMLANMTSWTEPQPGFSFNSFISQIMMMWWGWWWWEGGWWWSERWTKTGRKLKSSNSEKNERSDDERLGALCVPLCLSRNYLVPARLWRCARRS